MIINNVRAKLRLGETSLGTWVTIPHPLVAGMLARTEFDWLTVELEHTPITMETAALSFALVAARGKVPLARVPINSVENIKRVLDTGAYGVIVPMVNTRGEAEAVVAAARYAPDGSRSIGGLFHAHNFATDPATYYEDANDQILVVVMIETAQAVANVDEILSVPGIDACFIGPNDLHKSLGLPPVFESDHPAFVQSVELVLAAAKRHRVAAGIHVGDPEAARRRIGQGFQMIAVGSDAGFLMGNANEATRVR